MSLSCRHLPQLLLLILLCPACSSSVFSSNGDKTFFSDCWWRNSSINGHLYVISMVDIDNRNRRIYRVGGRIYNKELNKSENPCMDGGSATVSDVSLEYETDVKGMYHAVYGSDSAVSPPTFGAVSTWALTGNPDSNVPAFHFTTYVPQELTISGPVFENTNKPAAHSRLQPLTVRWNADSTNPWGVIVRLSCSEYPNNRRLDFPERGIDLSMHAPDTGEYTFDVEFSSEIPVNSVLIVEVIRGVQRMIDIDGNTFLANALTSDCGTIRLID